MKTTTATQKISAGLRKTYFLVVGTDHHEMARIGLMKETMKHYKPNGQFGIAYGMEDIPDTSLEENSMLNQVIDSIPQSGLTKVKDFVDLVSSQARNYPAVRMAAVENMVALNMRKTCEQNGFKYRKLDLPGFSDLIDNDSLSFAQKDDLATQYEKRRTDAMMSNVKKLIAESPQNNLLVVLNVGAAHVPAISALCSKLPNEIAGEVVVKPIMLLSEQVATEKTSKTAAKKELKYDEYLEGALKEIDRLVRLRSPLIVDATPAEIMDQRNKMQVLKASENGKFYGDTLDKIMDESRDFLHGKSRLVTNKPIVLGTEALESAALGKKILPIKESTYRVVNFQDPTCANNILYSDSPEPSALILIKNFTQETGKYDGVVAMAHFAQNNLQDGNTATNNLRSVVEDFKKSGGSLTDKTSVQLFVSNNSVKAIMQEAVKTTGLDHCKFVNHNQTMTRSIEEEGSSKTVALSVFVSGSGTQIMQETTKDLDATLLESKLITKPVESMPFELLTNISDEVRQANNIASIITSSPARDSLPNILIAGDKSDALTNKMMRNVTPFFTEMGYKTDGNLDSNNLPTIALIDPKNLKQVAEGLRNQNRNLQQFAVNQQIDGATTITLNNEQDLLKAEQDLEYGVKDNIALAASNSYKSYIPDQSTAQFLSDLTKKPFKAYLNHDNKRVDALLKGDGDSMKETTNLLRAKEIPFQEKRMINGSNHVMVEGINHAEIAAKIVNSYDPNILTKSRAPAQQLAATPTKINSNKRIMIFEDHFNSIKGDVADNLDYLLQGLRTNGIEVDSVSLEFTKEMKSAADIAKFFSDEQNDMYGFLMQKKAVEKIIDFSNKKHGKNVVGNSYENLSRAISYLDYDERKEITTKLFPDFPPEQNQRFALYLGRLDGTPGLVKLAKATEAAQKKCRFIDLTDDEKTSAASRDGNSMAARNSYMSLQMVINPSLGFFGLGHHEGLTEGMQVTERNIANPAMVPDRAMFAKVLPVSSNTVCLYPYRGKSLDPACDRLKQNKSFDRQNPLGLRAIDINNLNGRQIVDKLVEHVVEHERHFNPSKGTSLSR